MTQTLPDPNTMTFRYSGELYKSCRSCMSEHPGTEPCPTCGFDYWEWERRPSEEERRQIDEETRLTSERREAEILRETERRNAAVRAEKLEKAHRAVTNAAREVVECQYALAGAEKALERAKKALQRLEGEKEE